MPERRTYKGKHTIAEWWGLADQAQKSRRKIELFRELIEPGDLVFDIGANRGMMTMVFRWLDARVVAVEPLLAIAPQTIPELKWKYGSDPNVQIVPKAVAPTPEIAIWLHKNIPYLSSVNRTWMTRSAHRVYYSHKNCRKKTVEAITLDALITEYGEPKFIKIDVEGSENLVLKTLTHPVQSLSLEFHQDWIPKTGLTHLMGYGKYTFNWARNFIGDYVLPEWVSYSELMQSFYRSLAKKGPQSWGDLYAKRVD